ncbi:MAG: cytochrome c biogenesis protein CcsA [Piscinibacter sp.]|nr:cytochrome c biogenesis protein CcsA [Piscinibacter sp.]
MILSFGSADPVLAVPSAIALVGYGAAATLAERRTAALRLALAVGWLAHGLAIVADVAGIGSAQPGARFGFAPALSATLWLVLAVHAVESRFVPLASVRRALAVLGLAVVALAWWYPGESRPMAGSPWEPLHWVLGIASYGLFGAAVLHAALLSNAERRLRMKGPGGLAAPAAGGLPLLRLERLTFRFVAAGFAALSATLVLGWWFAEPWRWDHKTVFSLLGWFVFAGLLAGRHAFGWRGRRAAGWLYAGALLLMLAYVGSRFVLEVVLQRPSVG